MYSLMPMAAVCIMLEAERTTYRKMAGIPKEQPRHGDQDGADKNPLQKAR